MKKPFNFLFFFFFYYFLIAINYSYSQTPNCSTLHAQIYKTDIKCNGDEDGSASVDVTGGTPPYSYSWSNNMGELSFTPEVLLIGKYIVTISDAAGCVIRDSVTINEPLPLIQYIFDSTFYSR